MTVVKWVVRLLFVFSGLITLYLLVTFGQVWWASGRDGATESDAIVVLGAAQYDGTPSPVLESRLDHALELYRDEVAPVIVVTGGGQEGDRFTEAYASFEYLRHEGVPESALRLEVEGTNTWEELSASALILEKEGRDSAVLVSDSYHAYRIVATAEELGLDAHASPSTHDASFGELLRETGAVGIGRLIGYRRLVKLG